MQGNTGIRECRVVGTAGKIIPNLPHPAGPSLRHSSIVQAGQVWALSFSSGGGRL